MLGKNHKIHGDNIVVGTREDHKTLTEELNKTYKTYTGSVNNDNQNTILENWSKFPTGIFICELLHGSRVGAIVHKYFNENYGSVIIFGYSNRLSNPLYGRLVSGTWTWTEL